MIYMVTVEGAYRGLASSAKKALALAYCEMGRIEEVKDGKTFLKTVREIKKDLKNKGAFIVSRTNVSDTQVTPESQSAIVMLVTMKSVEEALDSKFGIRYASDS